MCFNYEGYIEIPILFFNCNCFCISERKLKYKPFRGESTENNLHRFYTQHVMDPLNKITEDVSCIYPLSFRVEILENAFSLLFLTRQNLEDDLESYSCSSEDGDDVSSNKQHRKNSKSYDTEVIAPQTNLDFGDSNIDNSHHVRLRSSKERCTIKNSATQHSSENASSCSAGSISNNRSRFGFLLNRFVVRSFLNCFKHCIVEASSTSKIGNVISTNSAKSNDIPVSLNVTSAINEKSLPVRLSTLFRYISEAQWRHQLVVGDLISKEERFSPPQSLLEEDSFATDWSFEFYRSAFSDEEEISDGKILSSR